MGRSGCCDKSKVKRGTWSPQEDALLKNYLHKNGTAGNWIALPNKAGLNRCGKSCRLRWLNYLRPDIKHGGFTQHEESTICTLYNKLGSRWSVIASHLRGRTDNDVKNYWNTKLKKKFMATKSFTETAVPADAIETTGAATSQAVPLALQDYSPREPYRAESATNEPTNFGSPILTLEESSDCSNGSNEMNLPFCPTHLEQDPSPFGSFCLGMDGSNEVMDEYSREIEWNLDDLTYINNIYNPLAN